MHSYSQLKAMLSITKASLRSTFRSPSAVVFSVAFPLIFILVFGFLSSGGNINVNVAMDPKSDRLNPVYATIRQIPGLKFVQGDTAKINGELSKGRITALISIQPSGKTNAPFTIHLIS
jgi:ABC-2 type transport system permease protein